MFRTKQDVDKHVEDILRKTNSESDINLKGYAFARLYFNVGDYQNALKYVIKYLSVRDFHAPSHHLLGQIYEGTGHLDKALQSYKRSLEIDKHQNDVILKICKLYCVVPVDPETARYWCDRATQLFSYHQVVHDLREVVLKAEGDPNYKEIEKFLTDEVASQPFDVNLRLKLLKLYMDTERVKEAYEHMTKVEKKKPYPASTEWYYMMVDIFEEYQKDSGTVLDFNFYVSFLTSLDHLVNLMVSEPKYKGNNKEVLKTPNMNDAAAVLLQFDQHLKKASACDFGQGAWKYVLEHMKGQLYYYLASLILKKAHKDWTNWKEACRLGAALLLRCYILIPGDLLHQVWFTQLPADMQKTFTDCFHKASTRMSNLGHVILSMCKEDSTKWLYKVKNDPKVQEIVYAKLFKSINEKAGVAESYFLSDATFQEVALEMPVLTSLAEYDKYVYTVHPDSLHHLLWLTLHQRNVDMDFDTETYFEEAFKGLRYSNSNITRGNPESLCLLDIEAFFMAALHTTTMYYEERMATGYACAGNFLSVPPDVLPDTYLCPREQGTWWWAACNLVRNSVKVGMGEHRLALVRGLEVIRGIDQNGMDVRLVAHLARGFADKVTKLSPNSQDVSLIMKRTQSLSERASACQERAIRYWDIVLGMLKKQTPNQLARPNKEKLFNSKKFSKPLTEDERTQLNEEGQMYRALWLMDAAKHDEAAEVLSDLASDRASYYLALNCKKLALEESTAPSARCALLTRAKDALYKALDRIKDESDPSLKHSVYIEIEEIEEIISNDRFGTTNRRQNSIRNEETFQEDYEDVDGSYIGLGHTRFARNPVNAAPLGMRPVHSTSHQDSPFNPRPRHHAPDHGINRSHPEPSPERLDAQVRSIALTQSSLTKALIEQQRTFIEQQRALLDQQQAQTDSNKTLLEEVKQIKTVLLQLKKQLDELHVPTSIAPRRPRPSAASTHSQAEEEEIYEGEANGYPDYEIGDLRDGFRQPGYDYGYSTAYPPSQSYGTPAPAPQIPPALVPYGYQPGLVPPRFQDPRSSFYQMSIGQGLTFSEGQPLPQFQFHIGKAAAQPPAAPTPVAVPLAPPPPPPPGVPVSVAQMTSTPPGPQTHAFQIPLPTPGPAAAVAKEPSVLSVPSPTIVMPTSIGSPTKAPGTPGDSFYSCPSVPGSADATNRSRLDSEVSDTDIEREVVGDFKPLIPLPAEVALKTGEEDEDVLFENRAKLFRYVEQEWKERGIGVIKLLKHKMTGLIRLVMRRDQVHKVCANHKILPTMSIVPLAKSHKALIWSAQDFSEEKIANETFCIRFETEELASAFKKVFEDCVRQSSLNEPPKLTPELPMLNGSLFSPSTTTVGFGTIGMPKAGSWSCPTCYVGNPGVKTACAACETPKPGVQKSHQVSQDEPLQTIFNTVTATSGMPRLPFTIAALSGVTDKSPMLSTSNVIKPPLFQVPPVVKDKETPKGIGAPGSVGSTSKSVFSNFVFPSNPTANIFAPKDDSKNVSKIDLTKSGFKLANDTKMEEKPVAAADDTKKVTTLGGFTFTSPVVVEAPKDSMKEREILVVTTKAKDGPQVSKVDAKSSPFSSFCFKLPGAVADTAPPSPPKHANDPKSVSSMAPVFGATGSFATFSDLKETSGAFKKDPSFKQFAGAGTPLFASKSSPKPTGATGSVEGEPETFVPTAEFRPVIPLPELVEVVTGEEEDEKLFGERAKLFRFDSEAKEWKERGMGEIKILYSKNLRKSRILMRRDQVLKICANHYILPEMKLTQHQGSEVRWHWFAQDFSEGTLRNDQFVVKFKNKDIASNFYDVFADCQKKLQEEPPMEAGTSKSVILSAQKDSSCSLSQLVNNGTGFDNLLSDMKQAQPLSEMFRPDPSSWQCPTCYLTNTKDVARCVSCESQRPGSQPSPKVASGGFTVNSAPKPPLSDMFKVDPTCWQCNACYLTNTKSDSVCVACATPKPGSVPAEKSEPENLSTKSGNTTLPQGFRFDHKDPFTSGFVFGKSDAQTPTTFKFGTTTISDADRQFVFKPNFGTTSSDPKTIFGNQPLSSKSSFVSSPSSTTASTNAFGLASKPNNNFGVSSSGSTSSFFGNDQGQASEGFKFGSPQKYEFSFEGIRPHSPLKCPKSPRSPGTPSDADNDEVESSDDIYFKPAVPLPPEVPVKTGEEEEQVLFCQRAKLFRFAANEWKERGVGELKILYNPQQKMKRLLMRRDQVLKVCANHYITKDITFQFRGEKSLTWGAIDHSENEAMPERFAVRFKVPEYATDFYRVATDSESDVSITSSSRTDPQLATVRRSLDFSDVSSTTESISEVAVTESQKLTSTSESPPKVSSSCAFSFSLDETKQPPQSPFALASRFGVASDGWKSMFGNTSTDPAPATGSSSSTQSDSEVDVVYQSEPTPEQVAAAKKLMLPSTFYLYQNLPDCPGCRGCKDDDDADHKIAAEPKKSIFSMQAPPQAATGSIFGSALSDRKPLFGNLSPPGKSQTEQCPASHNKPTGGGKENSVDVGASQPSQAVHSSLEAAGTSKGTLDLQGAANAEAYEEYEEEEEEDLIFDKRVTFSIYDEAKKAFAKTCIGNLKVFEEDCGYRITVTSGNDEIFCDHEIAIQSVLNVDKRSATWNGTNQDTMKRENYQVTFSSDFALQEFSTIFECGKSKALELQTVEPKDASYTES